MNSLKGFGLEAIDYRKHVNMSEECIFHDKNSSEIEKLLTPGAVRRIKLKIIFARLRGK